MCRHREISERRRHHSFRVNFAIKTGALRDFLDNSAVPYVTTEPSGETKTADIASAARTYTMLISCTAQSHRGERK